jgi:hypothetical protein
MHHFDELAKSLSGGLTRRQALRRAGGSLAGAVLASLGLERAWGQAPANPPVAKNCADFCKNIVGIAPGGGNAYGKCVSNCATCNSRGGKPCGASACCTGGLVCSSGTCVAPCTSNGDACLEDGDCCSDLCQDNICVSCLSAGSSGCTSNADCCADSGGCNIENYCCVEDGEPCDIDNPAACCSLCCELHSSNPLTYVCCS